MAAQSFHHPPVWQIWNNPIVRRYATARLRLLRVAGWSLVVQPLAAFLWLVVYFSTRERLGVSQAAFAAWTPILILQGLLWLLKGTFSVAVGIAREGAEGLSESQRLTPLSAWHKVVGYLFGLPILETALVASLLPWSVVSIVLGKVPLAAVCKVYLLLGTSAVLHHTIGLVAGTVIRQKIVAGTVSQVLVIGLHFVVPLLARFGLGPLGHLGVERVIAAELLPLRMRDAVPTRVRFFDFDVSLTGYSWVVMAILIVFLLQILRRRWLRADSHLFSKPLALAFSAWIILMTLGETFPLIQNGKLFELSNQIIARRQHGPEGEMSRRAVERFTQGLVPLGWAGAFGCVALLVAMLLTAVITPTLDQYGCARRARHGQPPPRLPWASDARSALPWAVALGLMALGGWVVLVERLLDVPLLHAVVQPSSNLPLIFGAGLMVPLLTWAILLEWRGLKIACLGAFLFWIIPVMVSVVCVLARMDPKGLPKWGGAMSGFMLPFYSLGLSMDGLKNLREMLAELRVPWVVSLVGHAVAAGVMFYQLRRAQRASAR